MPLPSATAQKRRRRAAGQLPQCIRGSTVFFSIPWTCFYQFLDNRSCSSWSILHDPHISTISFHRVTKALGRNVPCGRRVRGDSSASTSPLPCHDTAWDHEPKPAPKYVLKKPSKCIWGAIGSRGASGGGPGEIMISNTSSSVRLSVHFHHSISY